VFGCGPHQALFLCLPRIAALSLATVYTADMRLAASHTQTVRCRHADIAGSSSSVLLPQRSCSLVVRAASEPTSSQDEESQQAQKDAAQAMQDRAFPKTGLFSIADPNAEVCLCAPLLQEHGDTCSKYIQCALSVTTLTGQR
jgi:hypothetical protein